MRRFDRQGPLRSAIQRDGACARLTMRGEVDLTNADLFEEQILAAERLAGDELIVDLNNVPFMDVAGARVLARAAARAADNLRQIRVEPSAPVRRLLSALGPVRLAGLVVDDPAVAARPTERAFAAMR